MVQFTCTTCSESSDENEMLKHLSSTRHKTVVFEPLQETIECEECQDTNIHQLSILRYGGSDMALLCQLCLSKEEKASTQYSLSNGSLLKNVPSYFKFRDMECHSCGSDEKLNVSKDAWKKLVLCNNCLKDFPNANTKFTNENDDTFVYDFLGLKEYKPAPTRGRGGGRGRGGSRGRRGGRRGGRGGRGGGRGGRGSSRGSRGSSRGGSRGSSRGDSRGGMSSRGGGSRGISRGSSRGGRGDFRGDSKGSSRGGRGSARGGRGGFTPIFESQDGNSNDTIPYFPTFEESLNNGVPVPALVNDFNELNMASSEPEISTKKDYNRDQKISDSKSKLKVIKEKPSASIKASMKNQKTERNDIEKKGSKNSKTHDNKKTEKIPAPSTDKISVTPKVPQLRLPAGISSYVPSPTPKLTYSSMTEYFQEMCFNLFLEERMSIKPITNVTIEWHKDNNAKNNKFKAIFPLDEELQDRVSKKLQSIGKLPFSMNQALGLMLAEDIIWYGFVSYMDVKNGRRGKIIELSIELYKWNTQPLPFSISSSQLSMMPFSIPVSRILFAMSRISNPSFIKMLLGNDPIRQIVFKNYLTFTRPTFNDSQKVAIQSVLNNSITVLQGPPGTGKTSTIFEIILQLLDNLNTYPILVVAASNIAIDNIAEKLLPKHGKEILRIVSTEKESEYNTEHPLYPILLHHKIHEDLPMQFQQTKQDFKNPHAHVSQNQYKKLITKSSAIADKLIAQAKVIFTTTVVAGGYQLKSVRKFPVVIMDESTQSAEPTTLIPLSMPGVDKFVFVGDQKQLSAFSQVPNLQLSLFERVLLNQTYRSPHMLNVQYRMHPAISEFPIKKFYNNMLTDGITAEDRVMEGIEKPVYFWDTGNANFESKVRNNFREDHGFTYENPGEVDKIVQVLIKLIYEKKIDKSTIGIITPYRAQRDLISKKISENELINPNKDEVHVEVDRDDFYNDSKPVTIHIISDIMIASIDAFQGREKDFILFSCVRSNQINNIGFLKDERRLNVALTRARCGLVLVGNVSCLKQGDKLWDDYLTYLEEKQSIFSGNTFEY